MVPLDDVLRILLNSVRTAARRATQVKKRVYKPECSYENCHVLIKQSFRRAAGKCPTGFHREGRFHGRKIIPACTRFGR